MPTSIAKHKILGYGVMVTLQILVLPFLVRVRIPQQKGFLRETFFRYMQYHREIMGQRMLRTLGFPKPRFEKVGVSFHKITKRGRVYNF